MEPKFKQQRIPRSETAGSSKEGFQASELAFINVDNPTQLKDPSTRRKIHRHVMKEIGRTRRRDFIHPIEKHRDAAAPMTVRRVSSSLPRLFPSYWGEIDVCANFKRLFRAMDMVSEGLLSLVVVESLRKSPASLDMDLYGPFHVGSWDEMKLYTETLHFVRMSIGLQSRASRYAIIGTIICLAHFDFRVRNHGRWKMHMDGLERIVTLGGGVEVLESHQALRLSLFLLDVLGSIVSDIQPRFPPLERRGVLRPATQHSPTQTSTKTSEDVSMLDETALMVIDCALKSTRDLAALLNQVSRKDASPLTLDLLIPLCMIAHNVLSLPRFTTTFADYSLDSQRREAVLQGTPLCSAAELVRISALTLFSMVMSTTSADNLYCPLHRGETVRHLLVHAYDEAWIGREEWKLWVLVIQTLMETGSARPWFLGQIQDVMGSLSLRSWGDLILCLYQVAWFERAAMKEMIQLKSEIERRLTSRAQR